MRRECSRPLQPGARRPEAKEEVGGGCPHGRSQLHRRTGPGELLRLPPRRLRSRADRGSGGRGWRILAAVEGMGVRVEAILLTHTHFDHIGAVAPVAKATGATVYCPELEVPVLADIMAFVPWPGFGPYESYEADETITGGEKLELAGIEIDVLFIPGHSPGHVTYAIPEQEALFSGDVLFRARSAGPIFPAATGRPCSRGSARSSTAIPRRRRSIPATWGSRRSARSTRRIHSSRSWRGSRRGGLRRDGRALPGPEGDVRRSAGGSARRRQRRSTWPL